MLEERKSAMKFIGIVSQGPRGCLSLSASTRGVIEVNEKLGQMWGK
jgi:hypothetical protein